MVKLTLLFLPLLAAVLAGVFLSYFYSGHAPSPLTGQKDQFGLPADTGKFSLDRPPSDSQEAKIATFSGEVFWQSRTATQSSRLKSLISLKQGEELSTGSDGKAEIDFPTGQQIKLSENSKINLVQTLPQDLVVEQTSGTVAYLNAQSPVISIRAAGFLTLLSDGEVSVSFPVGPNTVNLAVSRGEATAAFNNLLNVTQVRKLSRGERAVFNGSVRTFQLFK